MQDPADQPPFLDPKRAAVLKHARRAFVRDGFAGAKMEPIAREAGVSTATLYSLFEAKTELFAAVIEDAADDFQRLMGHVRSASGTAPERLTHFATAYARFMGDPFIRSVFRLVMAERPRFRDVAMRFFDRGKSDFGGVLMQALREMDEAGELRVPHPSWAAGQLMGMIEHPIFFMPLVTGDEVRAVRVPDQIAADAVETFMARYGA
ncbi:MAG TPA: TetR/AcrR family transcriptional regulator [Brevundimonas sp.]|nr:TetR/AcrR family transcriptional regulator [Brevundimonas sp.]